MYQTEPDIRKWNPFHTKRNYPLWYKSVFGRIIRIRLKPTCSARMGSQKSGNTGPWGPHDIENTHGQWICIKATSNIAWTPGTSIT